MELPTRPRAQRLYHVVACHLEKFWRSKVIPAVKLAVDFLIPTVVRLATSRVMIFVLLASVFPGPRTIHPTEDCSLAEAKRCLELRGLCNPCFNSLSYLLLRATLYVMRKGQESVDRVMMHSANSR